MRYLIPCLALALGACCSDETRTITIEYEPYGPGTTDLRTVELEWLRDDGWACHLQDTLQDSSGEAVGERWSCTKCV